MRRTLVLALACATALPALAADERTTLTLYHAGQDQLFQPGDASVSDDGYAVVHERRGLDLKSGSQDLTLGGLPAALDGEALSLRFADGNTRVVSQRLLLGQGFDGAVAGLVGRNVRVLGSGGQDLATGTLVQGGNPTVVRDTSGQVTVIREAAALRVDGVDNVARGSTLQVRVDASSAGARTAQLDYPTTGLGWRGAYVATLAAGDTCRMTFAANASIANRSGRDWHDVSLKLVVGDAPRAKAQPRRAMVVMAARAPAPMAADANPSQAALGDLRVYTLPRPVDLPDGSVTQAPLYDSRTLACERPAVFDDGHRYYGNEPYTQADYGAPSPGQRLPVTTSLVFKAFESLPSGYVRVMTADRDGNVELLAEGTVAAPKGEEATIDMGEAFDLGAKEERSAFTVGDHTMDESRRITLSNAGDASRSITVRRHADRWRAWKLVSSSVKPVKSTADTLEFKVDVPAHGHATLDFAVRYTWTDGDLPRPR